MTFTRFLAIVRARLGVIGASIVIAVLAAGIVSLIMPTRYYAEATAVLEQPALDAAALASNGASTLSYFLATQRDVVGSRNVALRVIDSLELEKDPEKSRQLLSGWSPLGWLRAIVDRLLSGDEGGASTFRDWMVERLLKEVSITAGRDSRLLKVGFNSPSPEFSSAVANAFMHAFLDANVQLKAAPARTETAWLQGQLKELRDNLAQAEAKLSAFQQEKGIVATDEHFDHENQTLNDLSLQLAGAQSEAYAAAARRRQLQEFAAGKGGAAEVPSDVVTSPVVMRLREDVAQREAMLRDMSRQLGPNHPRYRTATGELEQLRGQLNVEMRSVAQGLASAGNVAGERESSLRNAVAQQKTRILGMKKEREQMAMLARDVDNAQRAYNSAEQRVAQSRIESANQRPNASVVDEAPVPARPSSPRIPLNLAIGGVLGAMLGLGIALMLESTQRLVRDVSDLVEMLGVPILAVLPPRALRGPMTRALGGNVLSLPKP